MLPDYSLVNYQEGFVSLFGALRTCAPDPGRGITGGRNPLPWEPPGGCRPPVKLFYLQALRR